MKWNFERFDERFECKVMVSGNWYHSRISLHFLPIDLEANSISLFPTHATSPRNAFRIDSLLSAVICSALKKRKLAEEGLEEGWKQFQEHCLSESLHEGRGEDKSSSFDRKSTLILIPSEVCRRRCFNAVSTPLKEQIFLYYLRRVICTSV